MTGPLATKVFDLLRQGCPGELLSLARNVVLDVLRELRAEVEAAKDAEPSNGTEREFGTGVGLARALDLIDDAVAGALPQ